MNRLLICVMVLMTLSACGMYGDGSSSRQDSGGYSQSGMSNGGGANGGGGGGGNGGGGGY